MDSETIKIDRTFVSDTFFLLEPLRKGIQLSNMSSF